MHPYMIELYIKALHEKREREAEYERLVASVNRLRRQRRLVKRPRWSIRFLHLPRSRNHDETPSKPTIDMNGRRLTRVRVEADSNPPSHGQYH
jgi:hypothetical protein